MELITVDIRFKIPTKNILILTFLHQFFHWRTKHPELTKEETVTQKKSNSWLFDSCAHLNTRCLLCTKPVWRSLTHPALHSLPVRSGGRILILVRQPDPRFTPRVWLVPIVHCQGLLMGRQQWILSPHKWLSDRAPSSITSYNVEVQKMRPSGGLIWCFICSIEKLLSFLFFSPPCKITTVQAC